MRGAYPWPGSGTAYRTVHHAREPRGMDGANGGMGTASTRREENWLGVVGPASLSAHLVI